jgi:hypothetical protein
MAKCIKMPYEWYPKGGDHSNILIKYRSKFFQKCKFFIEYLNYYFTRRKTNLNGSSLSFVEIKKEDVYRSSCYSGSLSLEEQYKDLNGKPFSYKEKECLLDENTFGINNPNQCARFKNSVGSNFSYEKEGEEVLVSCFGKRDSFDGENRISKGSLAFKDKNFEEQYNKYFQSDKRLKQLYNNNTYN